MGIKDICFPIYEWKNFLIIVFLPIVLLPIPLLGETSVSKCAYAVLIIGAYWVFEVMPIAVTSLIPVFLFPVLGIMKSADVCRNYANDTLMLFFGSLVVAAAVERWDLHKRIALRALTLVGPQPRWMMLGIMLPTWFLSMWMSNTATAAMMIPILNAILSLVKEIREKVISAKDGEITDEKEPFQNGPPIPRKESKVTIEMSHMLEPGTPVSIPVPIRGNKSDSCLAWHNGHLLIDSNVSLDDFAPTALLTHAINDHSRIVIKNRIGKKKESEDPEFERLAKTFALCTAYAANCGGIATITGTPPNIILKGQSDILFEEYGATPQITFANWLTIGIPLSFLVFLTTWVWLQIFALGKKCLCCIKTKEDYTIVKSHLRHEYQSLGPMSFAETIVLVNFILLAFLWILRNPAFIPGWGSLFPEKYVQDSTAAILMSVSLFVLPSEMPMSRRQMVREGKQKNYVPLMNWKYLNDKMAWGVLILMGGGFAVAKGCEVSGLSSWLSDQLMVLKDLPYWLTSAFLSYITAAITNVTSNAATATLFLPIVGSLAIKLSLHPLYFMIPCAVAASFAFMLPVGTPPNAIVFSTGYLTVPDMIKAGSVINFLSILITCLCLNSFIMPVFDLYTIPAAFLMNTTAAQNSPMPFFLVQNATDSVMYNLTGSA